MIRVSHVRRLLMGVLPILGLITGRGVAAEAGVPVSDGHVLRVWELEDGMPDHHVGSIARTRDGYLWLTTFSGLVRFDGRGFQLMGKGEIPGLPTPWIRPVFADSRDTLWLGLERGAAARWERGRKVEQFLPIQPRPTTAVWPTSIAEEAAGAIWYGSGHETSVFRWMDGGVTTFGEADGVPCGPRVWVAATEKGGIWCYSSTGCARFEDGRFVPVAENWKEERHLAASAGGGMWVVGEGRIQKWSDDGTLVSETRPPGLPGSITKAMEDREGALWIGTWGSGLFRHDGDVLEKMPGSLGLISALMEDDEGTVWVGTWGGGLDRLTRKHLFLHEVPAGTGLRSVAFDGEGELWMVSQQGALTVGSFGGGPPVPRTPEGWEGRDAVSAVLPDGRGGLWLATSSGLVHRDGERYDEVGPRVPVRSMLVDGDGALWIARAHGPVHHRGAEGWETLPTEEGLSDVRSLACDSEGRIWFGTMSGLLFVKDAGRIVPVPLPGAGGDEVVRFIVPDGRDVWIGALLGGLYRWRDGEVLRVPQEPALPLAEIRSLVIQEAEESDVFWIGTAQGLYSTTRRAIEGALESGEPIGATRHAGNAGLPSLEFPEGADHGAAKSTDGRIWFATNRGVLEAVPAARREERPSARVIIESARAGERELPLDAGGMRLSSKPGVLRIRYTLPELVRPEEVRFRYRLEEGAGSGWNFAGSDREVAFAGLAPGRYRFEVAAAVAEGSWLPGVAALEFFVPPPWWQTLPVRLAALGLLAAAVWGAVWLAARVRIRRLEQEHAIERERTRIARDMHDEVGADLTLIATTIRLAQIEGPSAVSRRMEEIAGTAKRAVDALDEIVWAVNPRYDSLAGTVEYLGKYAVRYLSSSGLVCDFGIPDRIPHHPLVADVRLHLLRVVKEALNNAVKHSRAAKVLFRISVGTGGLDVVIEDDGIGFVPDSPGITADGLRNMRERMEAIGGTIGFEKPTSGGTRVTLHLPLRHGSPTAPRPSPGNPPPDPKPR